MDLGKPKVESQHTEAGERQPPEPNQRERREQPKRKTDEEAYEAREHKSQPLPNGADGAGKRKADEQREGEPQAKAPGNMQEGRSSRFN